MEQLAGVTPRQGEYVAGSLEAASFVREFLALRQEGWDPDLAEFGQCY